MKITFLSPLPNLTGGIRVVAIHARALAEMGHEVVLAHPSPARTGFRRAVMRLVRGGHLTCREPPRPSHFDELGLPRVVFAGSAPLESELPDADVIVATWWETAEWVARVGPSKGAKVYFIQGHEVWDYLPQDRARNTYRLPLHKITISRWLRRLMLEEYGDADVSFVPNGVDLNQFRPSPRKKAEFPTVGLLYSSEPYKGSDVCIRAIEIARQRLPELRVLAFGLPAAPLKQLKLPAGAAYTAAPRQDEIPRLYSACDAWLFGSREEGFGLPLLEAMACGTPVIATPAGAAPELVEGGGGVLVPHEDVNAMANQIVKICTLRADDWENLSRMAVSTAVAHPWQHSSKAFERGLLKAIDKTETGQRSRSCQG